MKLQTSKKAGFTLVEIMIVVAIIGLLAAIAIPNFVRARAKAQINSCVANLKQIDGAKETWALEQHKKTGDTLAAFVGVAGDGTSLVPDYIKSEPVCPAGATKYGPTIGAIGTNPTCPNYNAADNDLKQHVLP